jgi:hypothetical protein
MPRLASRRRVVAEDLRKEVAKHDLDASKIDIKVGQ